MTAFRALCHVAHIAIHSLHSWWRLSASCLILPKVSIEVLKASTMLRVIASIVLKNRHTQKEDGYSHLSMMGFFSQLSSVNEEKKVQESRLDEHLFFMWLGRIFQRTEGDESFQFQTAWLLQDTLKKHSLCLFVLEYVTTSIFLLECPNMLYNPHKNTVCQSSH